METQTAETGPSRRTALAAPVTKQKELTALAAEIKADIEAAQGASKESLASYASAGRRLAQAKTQLGHGNFEPWCIKTVGHSPQWRSQLMQLSKGWGDYEVARAWAEENGDILGPRELSVEGAVKLLKRYARRDDPPKPEKEKQPSSVEKLKAKVTELESENTRLQTENTELNERYAQLLHQVELGKRRVDKQPKPDPEPA